MLPFFGNSKPAPSPKIVDKAALDKLSGYHDLAKVLFCAKCVLAVHHLLTHEHLPPCYSQDAVNRAVQKDEEGSSAAALKIYQVALDACAEGLQLNVPPGVDPTNSNVGKWRREMQTWADRCVLLDVCGGMVAYKGQGMYYQYTTIFLYIFLHHHLKRLFS